MFLISDPIKTDDSTLLIITDEQLDFGSNWIDYYLQVAYNTATLIEIGV